MLLDEKFKPKLSDFGLAREGPSAGNTHVSTAVCPVLFSNLLSFAIRRSSMFNFAFLLYVDSLIHNFVSNIISSGALNYLDTI